MALHTWSLRWCWTSHHIITRAYSVIKGAVVSLFLTENSDSGAKTISASEASRLGKPAASRSGHTERTERSGRTERPRDLRAIYSESEPRRTEPSVAASSKARSTLGPPPSLNSYRGHRPASTTSSHVRRLELDKDLDVERDRYRYRG
ncbi:hypothetical protein BCON_0206g00130 [Botryotinia convoluta]|uniref:Uncharacterized protein n=1 Tax=Botryotinia convoluta TaxID=54673 RepID=A0A4Z1HKK8_9HELO|nr:hypothetical protein BCON_0206g00130 [Botryotinia convoluta]